MADEALSQHEHGLPHGPLIRKLNDLRDFCGGPSLGDIERISKQLATHYGARYGKVTLSQPTVSAVLAGHRKKPPKQAWLVTFVLTCEWYAWKEAGVPTQWDAPDVKRTGPPDPDRVLVPWISEHQATLAAYRSRAATSGSPTGPARPAGPERSAESAASARPVRPSGARPDSLEQPRQPSETPSPGAGDAAADPAPDPADGPPVPDRPEPAPGGPPPDPPPGPQSGPSYATFQGRTGTAAMREPIRLLPPAPELDASQTRIRHEFGLLGLQLYDRAQEGHIEAAFRLGVLLCANGSTTEGRFYLDKAKDHRHAGAAALGRVLERDRLRQRALDAVYEFARTAHTDNELLTAVSYCAIAARNDHADAAHMLATLLMGIGQGDLANLYLRYAARLGHLAARESVAPRMAGASSRGEVEFGSSQLLASIAPEPRFDSASATQPIDMPTLFATMDAEELAEAVQRIPLASTTSS